MTTLSHEPAGATIRHTGPGGLPRIPVFQVGRDFAVETLEIAADRAHAFLDEATAYTPGIVLKAGDAISRRWLERSNSPYLGEIDRIAALIGRPGAHYFNTSYEWGCTSGAGPCPVRGSARLIRTLDWPTPGLGRNVIAAQIEGGSGPWVSLTWPGYTGVLQAMAPGRFAAALNQAPMEMPAGFLPLDWAINRSRVWRTSHPTAAHLLRRVFETAESYSEAKRLLTDSPICVPAIYSLTGAGSDETCVIERLQDAAHVISGPATAANDWQRKDWKGRIRGDASRERRQTMSGHLRDIRESFDWLQPPIRNDFTRLALIADADAGKLVAQGYESDGAATQVLFYESPPRSG